MPIRDLLILAIVIGAAITALRRPWVGVMLWTWLSIMNPHRYAWGLAYSAPLAAMAAGSTLLGLLFTSERQSPFQGKPVWWLAAFSVWMTITWLLGLDPAGDYWNWDRAIKVFAMTFVALALLVDKFRVMAFAWVTTASLALLALKGGVFTLLTGGNYLVWGPPQSFIADNNHFALATIIIVPMVYFLYTITPRNSIRYALLVTMALCAICSLGSHSRGALLALIAMGGFLWWRSPHKLLTGILIVVMITVYIPFLPDQWWDRMETIQNFEQDASAMGRINAWIVAWETAKAYPFGGGMSYQHAELFERFGVYETKVRAAHSIYFQILGNHGFVGLFLYLGLWVSSYRTAGWLRKNARGSPETEWAAMLGSMVQVSLVGFAVGGAFLSLSYFDLPYNLMVMVVLARRLVLDQTSEVVAPKTTAVRGRQSRVPTHG
ncbi:putative O-glycosylation ligase, exosortase A system-associated [Lentisalinibacter salinarum]|uniref:putative O-glycosylation ligase, exosortase A system-associated n=1 Tax=Lentisalinibacter salinarum TaxID=2992239 RepID=UPI00386C23BD